MFFNSFDLDCYIDFIYSILAHKIFKKENEIKSLSSLNKKGILGAFFC